VSAAVLGVERSLTGRRWRPRLADDRAGLALAQRLALPEIVGRVLAARGVSAEAAQGFLAPRLRQALPDPSCLQDLDRAVARLVRAIEGGERIAVFADYDVDGATGAALLYRYLAAIGAPPLLYIPDRLTEGYGVGGEALAALQSRGAGVAITVDCGITAFKPLAAARARGLDVIVVDHHVAEPRLPEACAVIDPNRLDDTSGLGGLSAVGVAFLLAVGLNRSLRGRFSATRPEPDLRRWLDLVCLGTVCDLAPLTGLNRAFVAQGLKVMARRGNLGIAALIDVAGVREAPGTYHVGFLLGPRINAGGRVGDSALGVRLLTTEDAAEAAALAARLDALNRERQAIEAMVERAALEALGAAPDGPVVFAAGAGWHPGVVGIVAARLVERFARPAFVLGIDGDEARGSARSVPGVDVGSAVIAARQAGVLEAGGGHPAAAGLTVRRDRIAALEAFLTERLGPALAGRTSPQLGLDGAIRITAATPELAERLARVGPFGMGNAEPRFAVADARIAYADVVADRHLRLRLVDEAGGRLEAMAFRSVDTELGRALMTAAGRPLHLAGHLRIDHFRGRERARLMVEDAARPAGEKP